MCRVTQTERGEGEHDLKMAQWPKRDGGIGKPPGPQDRGQARLTLLEKLRGNLVRL